MTTESPSYSTIEQAFSLGNGQDSALNWLRKNRTPVAIFLVSGIELEGIISGFDQYSVLLTDAHGNQQLVYKAKISTIAMHSGRPQVSIQRARKPRVTMSPRPYGSARGDESNDQ
ncbi:RNA-binding protein hfq [Aeromonas schubertii]|uniref:RNA chaperone Hfq n=1 Tax=Aeromonas schubertii TaxID=652 RepID=UPI00067EC8CC|nr:RNA chaperone Hfq [Aeromonas schubertii]KUE79278.1 RNA-binding protein hfq [Aeromonas schubertii]